VTGLSTRIDEYTVTAMDRFAFPFGCLLFLSDYVSQIRVQLCLRTFMAIMPDVKLIM
jgi:hypothetical protein